MKDFVRISNVNSVKIEKVIIVKSVVGKGTKEDSCREITEIYDLKGRLIARIDPCKEEIEGGENDDSSRIETTIKKM